MGIGVAGAVGVTMMPWDASLWMKHSIFWISAVIFVAGLQWLVHLHAIENHRLKSKIIIQSIPPVLLLTAILFIEAPRGKTQQPISPGFSKLVTYEQLYKLYQKDFSAGGSYHMEVWENLDLTTLNKEPIEHYEYMIGVHADFLTNSFYLSFYIPYEKDADQFMVFIAKSKQRFVDEIKNGPTLVTQVAPGGSGMMMSRSMVFTGKIYVYYENLYSDSEIDNIKTIYEQNNIIPVFRGFPYEEYANGKAMR